MHSISIKLASALLVVVVVSVGLAAYLINRSTKDQFEQYLVSTGVAYGEQAADDLEDFYTENGGWNNVQNFFDSLSRLGNYRLILADTSGTIIGDTNNMHNWIGTSVTSRGLNFPISLTASNQDAGDLYLIFPTVGQGWGHFSGMRMQGQMALASEDQAFLDQANKSLIIGGVVSAIVAVVIGLILTRYFTKPIRELKKGARLIANGDLSYKVAVKTDDELGELAKSFNTMAESLNNSEQARQRLFADIAHELRTPLSVIEGTVDAMLDGVFEQNTANLNSIKEETTLLTRLVADLRDLTLAESGQLKLTIEPTDMADLIQRRAAQSEVIAREKNITLSTNIAEGLPNANIDGGRIDQVISNLISNAIKNTPPDGNINVLASLTEDNQSILISVTDTGEGIPKEHLPHIFERFYRVDEARSRKAGGAGLGLAIAKQMIELQGGKIWVSNTQGEGSTFNFTVPLG